MLDDYKYVQLQIMRVAEQHPDRVGLLRYLSDTSGNGS